MNQWKLLTAFILLAFHAAVFGAEGNLPGAGTEDNPFLIEDKADFDTFANLDNADIFWALDVYTELMVPLDLSQTVYTTAPIAPDTDPNAVFFKGIFYQGNFDGNGQPISGLTIEADPDNDYLGLFGMIQYAIIENVVLEDVQIIADGVAYFVGGLCGYSVESLIEACSIDGIIKAGGENSSHVGMLAGSGDTTQIFDSYTSGSIENGGDAIGGFLGASAGGSALTCYANVDVDGQSHLGGFVGFVQDQIIYSCYTQGNISGIEEVGGFIGHNDGGEVTYCYSTGKLTSSGTIGGFCAAMTSGSDEGNFWDKTTSETDISTMGTGLSTFFMQMSTMYHNAGWLFIDAFGDNGVWHMPYEAEGYPMLFFQKDIPGDIAGFYGVDFEDLAVFNQSWLTRTGDEAFNPACDLEQENSPGQIVMDDMIVLMNHWLVAAH